MMTGTMLEKNMNFDRLKIVVENGIARISLSRPEVRNAFDPQLVAELTAVFREIGKEKGVRAIHLSGEGKSFCAGADLGYMQSIASYSFADNEADSKALFDMFWTIRSCPLPVVAKIHGHAMGGAVGLAAVSDVVAAEENTQFCFSEVKLGLAPAVISPFILEKASRAWASRYMLGGEIFSARAAQEGGLVQFVGSAEQVEGFVENLLGTLTRNGPEALRSTKFLLQKFGETTEWSERKSYTARVISERRVSAEGQEGLRSFFEKRKPSWARADSKGE